MHGLKYKKKQRTKRMLNMGKFMNTDKQNNNFCGLKIWKGLKNTTILANMPIGEKQDSGILKSFYSHEEQNAVTGIFSW